MLVGYDAVYRIRVGDHRVIYEIRDDALLIDVFRIRDRRDAYRKM
jgi:mRNA interferase RelE/StbE